MKTIIKSLVVSSPFIFVLILNQSESIKEASLITGCIYAITFAFCRLILHPFVKNEHSKHSFNAF